jgi:hypothetical protein
MMKEQTKTGRNKRTKKLVLVTILDCVKDTTVNNVKMFERERGREKGRERGRERGERER